jgi:cephalosporin hydroxylase
MSNDLPVTGNTLYKGYTAQQHRNALDVFYDFLADIRPVRVLEIGTACGGLILGIREHLNSLGLSDTQIISYDIESRPYYPQLRDANIDIRIENIFTHAYTDLKDETFVKEYIQSPGVTLVLCDGGYKQGEFAIFSKFLKVGDFIMAHDYVDTHENFQNNFLDKIWNWCEIEEKHISGVCKLYNLVSYNKEVFDPVVWVCKKREAAQRAEAFDEYRKIFPHMETLEQIKTELDSINMEDDFNILNQVGVPSEYFKLRAGAEHYRLLRKLSSQYTNSVVVEVGAYYGASHVALATNNNSVVSFDVSRFSTYNKLEEIYKGKFITDSVMSEKFVELLLLAKFIVVDTMHDGVFERQFYDHLKNIGYRGIVVWDDIHLNDNMSTFWNGLNNKLDITLLGHITGTGITFM